MAEMNFPKNRDALGFWLNSVGLVGEGAEIGVAAGNFSRKILETWKGRILHMVDLWQPQDPDVYREVTNQEANFDGWLQEALTVARNYKRAFCYQGDSVEVSKSFKDGELDFAYIDANHSFEAVSADLNAWWPKVKVGGMIGGHDFQDKTDDGWYCQVESAVTAWTGKRHLQFVVTSCSSFWIPKL